MKINKAISVYFLCFIAIACITPKVRAQTQPDQLAREIHKELVEIDTTTASDNKIESIQPLKWAMH